MTDHLTITVRIPGLADSFMEGSQAMQGGFEGDAAYSRNANLQAAAARLTGQLEAATRRRQGKGRRVRRRRRPLTDNNPQPKETAGHAQHPDRPRPRREVRRQRVRAARPEHRRHLGHPPGRLRHRRGRPTRPWRAPQRPPRRHRWYVRPAKVGDDDEAPGAVMVTVTGAQVRLVESAKAAADALDLGWAER